MQFFNTKSPFEELDGIRHAETGLVPGHVGTAPEQDALHADGPIINTDIRLGADFSELLGAWGTGECLADIAEIVDIDGNGRIDGQNRSIPLVSLASWRSISRHAVNLFDVGPNIGTDVA
jgi:hypothetical protein